MTFLKNIDSLLRLEIQYKAFIATKNLTFLDSIIAIPSFINTLEACLDIDISKLKVKPNLRLGNRLEYFLVHALTLSNEFSILAKNSQVVENKITLGELDYIIQDNRNDIIFHLELANKFYLYDPSIPQEIERWIGPNRNDSLIRKITKLKQKQFPMLFHNKTIEVLNDSGIDVKKVEQKLLFKAQLFLPEKLYKGSLENDNIEGFYITTKEFQNKEYHDFLFFVPEKQDWQVNPKYCQNWFSYKEIQANTQMYLTENKSPLMWLKKPNGKHEKFFIVWW